MSEPFPIRAINEDEFDAFSWVNQHAFLVGELSPQRRARFVGSLEFDRTLAAFDGDLIVGRTGAWSFQLSVPGAVVPTAGVTIVSVLPTHRRRGILRSLMRRQLNDIVQRGEPLAALWASEAAIYDRYGYGRASTHATWTVHRNEYGVAPQAPRDPSLRLRLVEPEEARPDLAKVYEAVMNSRPGLFARAEHWWNGLVTDSDGASSKSPLRCVIAEDRTGTRGYTVYRGVSRWDDGTGLADGTIEVSELMGIDPAAELALWENLFARDLVSGIKAHLRPADDPLQFQLADARRLRQQVFDGLWVRLTDLPAALSARAYSAPVDVVLEVRDELLPANAGRWRLVAAPSATASGPGADGLSADGPGASGPGADGFAASGPGTPAAGCHQTTDAPDISLDVRELGAAYLGGTSLGSLAAAGLVTEHRAGAVRALSAAMLWTPSPWCPMIF